MNRLGLENFTEHLDADMSFQTSDQIIMYTSPSGSGILGIWIYEEADRVRIPEQLGQCCKSAKSAFSGQSPQRLYPKNVDEEKEFERLHPRSRSNSRRDAGADYQGSSNTLSTIISRTRQQQQHSKQNAASANLPTVPDVNALDLASKLQAIGIDFNAGPDVQQQDPSANARELLYDPAIITARKSVKPHEGSTASSDSQGQQQQQQQSQAVTDNKDSEFRSPLSVPSVHTNGAIGHFSVAGSGGAPASVMQPPSPVLHPAPSPFPPSTIATPLPAQGLQRAEQNMAYVQQMPQHWSHPQMACSPPVNRSAHASPAPPSYGGMVPGMYAFPQLSSGHPGYANAAHVPQPMMHMGPPPPLPQQQPFVSAPMQAGPQIVQNPSMRGPHAAGNGSNTSVAHNLAEQLVALVRQRMSSIQQGQGSGSTSALGTQQQIGVPPSAAKAQRDYCREWLIRVIQADDELVDAFAQRFPPPIFPPGANK
ncbi:hypothetical protein GGI04_001000 [Coemansia thaxteri]|nr:hypothetical protein GGI04_001000 [Coemansia thaxteri]KAJ2472897.1 hypothetical protein GGI02_001252 [Coemansia sp. RSA 2322]KAJ2486620.1 hypothetical protein EV174_000993 [Coemansia sp. RSA 2320]